MNLQKHNIIFTVVLLINIFLLLYLANNFSISYKEALIYFNDFSLLQSLTRVSTTLFGQNGISLRLPFILFYVSSVILMYKLTYDYFKTQNHRLISIIIFMILPGINSAALLVSEAIIVVFFILLYLYLSKITKKEQYWLLLLCLFVDNSFAIMYLALFFYSLQKKDNTLLVVSLILFGASMQIYGFDASGRPRGYFLDTFGAYASVFSPIIFLYFFYSLYRNSIRNKKDIYWYISFTALCFSLLFSLRQRIYIEDFAPFIVIAIPSMVKLFMHSYRVRLPQFRKNHNIFAFILLSTLVINYLVFLVNEPLYLLLKESDKHFAYNHHIAKDVANELKKRGISNILCEDKKLQLRLQYYNIFLGNRFYLSDVKKSNSKKIAIIYMNKTIKKFYLSKIK